MFWRWAGVDPTAVLSGTDFNEAATIGARLPLYTCTAAWGGAGLAWLCL